MAMSNPTAALSKNPAAERERGLAGRFPEVAVGGEDPGDLRRRGNEVAGNPRAAHGDFRDGARRDPAAESGRRILETIERDGFAIMIVSLQFQRLVQLAHLRARTADRCAARPSARRKIEPMIEHDPRRAAGEDDGAVREEGGFDDRVGDEDRGHRVARPQGAKLVVEVLTRDLVEGGEGFVEQEQFRIVDQRAGERGAHAHPAGELGGVAADRVGEADLIDCGFCPRDAIG
jgi:hypothetical protein